MMGDEMSEEVMGIVVKIIQAADKRLARRIAGIEGKSEALD